MKNAYLAILVVCATFGPLTIRKAEAEQVADRVSLGLEIGETAPSFRLKDQFGHNQSNETLQFRYGLFR